MKGAIEMWVNAIRAVAVLICAGTAIRHMVKASETEEKIRQLREQAAYRAKHRPDRFDSVREASETGDDGGGKAENDSYFSELVFLLWTWQRHIIWMIWFWVLAVRSDSLIG